MIVVFNLKMLFRYFPHTVYLNNCIKFICKFIYINKNVNFLFDFMNTDTGSELSAFVVCILLYCTVYLQMILMHGINLLTFALELEAQKTFFAFVTSHAM